MLTTSLSRFRCSTHLNYSFNTNLSNEITKKFEEFADHGSHSVALELEPLDQHWPEQLHLPKNQHHHLLQQYTCCLE